MEAVNLIIDLFKNTASNQVFCFASPVLIFRHRMVLQNASIDTLLRWFVPFLFKLNYHLCFGFRLLLLQSSPLIAYQHLHLLLKVLLKNCLGDHLITLSYALLVVSVFQILLHLLPINSNQGLFGVFFLGMPINIKVTDVLIPPWERFTLVVMYVFMKLFFPTPFWLHLLCRYHRTTVIS